MFPEAIETDSLALNQLCEAHVDVFDFRDLFAEGREEVTDVFDYVPEEPGKSAKDAHDQLVEAETAREEGDTAQYAVYTADVDLAGYAALSIEWERRTGNVGFILAKPYWGRDYAGECEMG